MPLTPLVVFLPGGGDGRGVVGVEGAAAVAPSIEQAVTERGGNTPPSRLGSPSTPHIVPDTFLTLQLQG